MSTWTKDKAVEILNTLDKMPAEKLQALYAEMLGTDASPFAMLLRPKEMKDKIRDHALKCSGIKTNSGVLSIG